MQIEPVETFPVPEDDWVMVGEPLWRRMWMCIVERKTSINMILVGLIGFVLWTKFGFATIFLAMMLFGVVMLLKGRNPLKLTTSHQALLTWLGLQYALGRRNTATTSIGTFVAIQTYFNMPTVADVSSFYHGLRRRIR